MTTTIKVTRARVTGRPGRAWHWHYYAQGRTRSRWAIRAAAPL